MDTAMHAVLRVQSNLMTCQKRVKGAQSTCWYLGERDCEWQWETPTLG